MSFLFLHVQTIIIIQPQMVQLLKLWNSDMPKHYIIFLKMIT